MKSSESISGQSAPLEPLTGEPLTAALRDSTQRAIDHLLQLQEPDGYWCAELEGDSILQSEYILFKWIIHEEDDARLPLIGNYLRSQQREDGTWGQYPGGTAIDISASVKAYFSLKLLGDAPDAPHMQRAREAILQAGGAERCNSFSKFYLALLGQIRYSAIPSIPPEMVYLPKWFYFHLDKVSAWTRTMITPLSIITSHKPVRTLPPEMGIDELYLDQNVRHRLTPTAQPPYPAWTKIFLAIDRVLKFIERAHLTPLRERSLKRIEKWIVDHTQDTDGLGAIFPSMVYIQIALRCRGWSPDDPIVLKARKDLDDLMIVDEEKQQIRIQPCFSPIWDTGIAAYALTDAGLDQQHEALARCADWLVKKECRKAADWAANVRTPVEPSGWYFEYNNPFYPDVDDTVMVSMALKRIGGDDAVAAAKRGVAWVLAMQNDDGGWAAFDRTEDRPILEYVPFADHNAIQDPSCPDITGRTLECLGQHGMRIGDPRVDKAIAFIRSRQESDGCWFGRWGVNYLYGTWQVVGGIKHVGQEMNADWVQKAGAWFKSVQKEDGSFGESCDSYEDATLKGIGPSTASQTAWAAMGMMAIYGPNDPNVQRALAWLSQTQLDSGTWDEPWFTGTGFPRVFYLRYHLYRLYFPLMAMGRWLTQQGHSVAQRDAIAEQ